MKPMLCLLVVVLSSSRLSAADWPHWRGPFYNGSTDETGLPDQFSPSENVRWVAELPGPGAATPIVWGDSVFVPSTDVAAGRLLALCFDRSDGRLRWKQDMGDEVRKDTRSTFVAPSPVTDGERVIFFYGNGALGAFDLGGRQLWRRDIQRDYGAFAFLWTFSSSPLLYGGKLYVQVLQRDKPVQGRGFPDRPNESYLLALDPRTGAELWRVVRPSEAVEESREAFSSPIPLERPERKEILVAGGDCLTGHDPATGRELWRWGTWNPGRIPHWRLVPSPVASPDMILACAPKGDPVYAIPAGGQGALDENAVAWVSKDAREISSDVPTPAYYDGDFFVLRKTRPCISRVEPQTGSIQWTTSLPTRIEFEASPLLADGKAYMINHAGLVVIVDARTGEISRQIAMSERSQEPIRSSIAAAGGHLFIRTNDKLYCIGP